MIAVIDYQMGNLGSIINMFKKIGAEAYIAKTPREVRQASKLVLPGVGAFDRGIQNIRSLGLERVLQERVIEQKVPILGICLGMQLMTNSSEEGQAPGLGWIDARTVKFQAEPESHDFKIPHMGWNYIRLCKESLLFKGLDHEARYYFVHSYYVVPEYAEDQLTATEYGHLFCSAFQRDNIFGVQFHPEKSHKFGMTLLKNFVEMN